MTNTPAYYDTELITAAKPLFLGPVYVLSLDWLKNNVRNSAFYLQLPVTSSIKLFFLVSIPANKLERLSPVTYSPVLE